MQTGPCILVGHSYGGGLITEAGNNPQVVGLVYIAAHAPDKGESEQTMGNVFHPFINHWKNWPMALIISIRRTFIQILPRICPKKGLNYGQRSNTYR